MSATLLHTADWHLGKTFCSTSGDPDAQARLRAERFEAVGRVAAAARSIGAQAVLVAGDVFHTHEVEDKWIVEALRCIGAIGLPVIAIPGNHDHAGAGSVWERRALIQNRARLAPNLTVVTDGLAKIPVGDVDVIAQPVRQRFEQVVLSDLGDVPSSAGRPRVGLVHAATVSFDEDGSGRALDSRDGERARLDYLALGDFHRQQQVPGMPCLAWYAGTHEPDGFPSHHQPGERVGSCLRVDVRGPGDVQVVPLKLDGGLSWLRRIVELRDYTAVDDLITGLRECAHDRVRRIVCQLDVAGSALAIADRARFQRALDDLRPLLLALQVHGEIALAPSASELLALCSLPGAAGLAARRLRDLAGAGGPPAALAQCALARLHEFARMDVGDAP